jgi:hypothetical protein
MRILSAAIAATFFVVSSSGAFAVTPAPAQALKSESSFELIKSGKGPGKCGVGKYWKTGKCLSAADKKAK